MERRKSNKIEFVYLYRDASNYKFWHSIIFTNPASMRLEEAEERVRRSLDGQELFIAHQVRIPETFPFLKDAPTEEDHCFHEFACVDLTTKDPTDAHGRSISEFVREIEDAARLGWRAFDPHYSTR